MMKEFWDKWIKAGELERLKLVRDKLIFTDYANASLANSYFTDLEEYLNEGKTK